MQKGVRRNYVEMRSQNRYNRIPMKRVIPAVFISIAAALVMYLILHFVVFSNRGPENRARVVTPQVNANGKNTGEFSSGYDDDGMHTSFITLGHDETLISSIGMDFDGDGYDDQISAIKTAVSQYLSLVVALYNPQAAAYERAATIATKITQVQTFSFTSMDVVGNHRNALVYQGFTEKGNSILQILFGSRSKKGALVLSIAGNFESDGSVYIQQLDRDESYELSQAKGVSFPVLVNSTEEKEGSNQLDQLQTVYNWSEKNKEYVQVSQSRIAGYRIAEKELARIQDGTVKTFAGFLNGLWYKTDNNTRGIRYIFFDYPNSEIIFLYEDSEEVYSWVSSNVRRNGIYLSTVNTSIENLQRRFDISLASIDEIRIKLNDDVRMIIGEGTLWDGSYKKMSASSALSDDSQSTEKDVIADLIKGPAWYSTDNNCFVFMNDSYQISGEGVSLSGMFAREVISGTALVQCRPSGENQLLPGSYLPYYMKLPVTAPAAADTKKIKDVPLYDPDTIVLQPVITSPTGFFQAEASPLILRRGSILKPR